MNPTVIWQGEIPIPKSPNKQVATYRLVHIRGQEFVCEKSSRDSVGATAWTVDKDALTLALGAALIERVAMCDNWANRFDSQCAVVDRLTRELDDVRGMRK